MDLNCWSLSCSWSIACRRCSNYIFILYLTHGFNRLGKDKCKTRGESFKFWDLVRLILDILRYITVLLSPHGGRCKKFDVSLHVQAKHWSHVAWFHKRKSKRNMSRSAIPTIAWNYSPKMNHGSEQSWTKEICVLREFYISMWHLNSDLEQLAGKCLCLFAALVAMFVDRIEL